MKKLVLSPHIDDEVLGCGGILDADTFVLHCGVEDRSYVSAEERVREIREVQRVAGFGMRLLKNTVNAYGETDLIGDFEKVINEVRPDQAYIPYPSYNQDHRAVFNAAIVALRPHDQNFFVKKVLVYEQEHVLFWSENRLAPFHANYFIPIDIERKLTLYGLLRSQVRSFRSPEHLRAMARVRGAQANCAHAEAFEVLRWID